MLFRDWALVLWTLITKRQTPWASVGKQRKICKVQWKTPGAVTFEALRGLSSYMVRNGLNISFWSDRWLGNVFKYVPSEDEARSNKIIFEGMEYLQE
ncbi:hypothetical protein NC651_026825 [Populus alba x Populus x berolinensis]|nr:hypothetical protein NC651_026815 [Populus alba x Populus x berolinensis]KAJ6886261.1 hypothetical protein NC651_026825 [Populus alba x Populus x berolinensis]